MRLKQHYLQLKTKTVLNLLRLITHKYTCALKQKKKKRVDLKTKLNVLTFEPVAYKNNISLCRYIFFSRYYYMFLNLQTLLNECLFCLLINIFSGTLYNFRFFFFEVVTFNGQNFNWIRIYRTNCIFER